MDKFSEKRFNKARAYLMSLFSYMIEMGAVNSNVHRDVRKMVETENERLILTDKEVDLIKKYLYEYNRPFYKFMLMFYYSGARIKELMTLQGRDVDLIQQKYKCLIKKGKRRTVSRTIRNVALPLWREQMKYCKPDDFVFSKELLPGSVVISSRQVAIRWRRHVKIPLGIKCNFYALKHRNSELTVKGFPLYRQGKRYP
jgi:integrase